MPPGETNYVRIKDRVPRAGKGVDALLLQLGAFLKKEENKYTQMVVIDATKPYLYFEKMVPPDQAPAEAEVTWHDAIRQVPMQELSPTSNQTAAEYLMHVFGVVNKNDLEVCQVLVHPATKLFAWLDISMRADHVFGCPVARVGQIPDDVIIVCGARSRTGDPVDVEFAVKGSIP